MVVGKKSGPLKNVLGLKKNVLCLIARLVRKYMILSK